MIYYYGTTGGGGGGGGITTVQNYSALPAANLHNGEYYGCYEGEGVWLLNRKPQGIYYSNGVTWILMGPFPEEFNTSNYRLYDNADTSKQIQWNITAVSGATTRTITMPNHDVDLIDGPATSTDHAFSRWDGATGSKLQDSVVICTDAGAVSGITQLDVDNIRIDGNTISSTDANGNINLTPNAAGNLVLDGNNWPQAAGSVGDFLYQSGATQTSWKASGNCYVDGFYGDGSDGDHTVGGAEILTRDMYYNTLTVPNGATLYPVGFKIFCKVSCTIDVGGKIDACGSPGTDGAAGGNGVFPGTGGLGGLSGAAGAPAGYDINRSWLAASPCSVSFALGGAGASNQGNGSNGNTGTTTPDVGFVTNSLKPVNCPGGPAGGAGGNAPPWTGGTGGAGETVGGPTELPPSAGGCRDYVDFTSFRKWDVLMVAMVIPCWYGYCGCSGGGGGGAALRDGLDNGAGGGGGGEGGKGGNAGGIYLASKVITNNGSIEAKGGNGGGGGDGGDGWAAGGNAAGGGGGGGSGANSGNGGLVVLAYGYYSGTGTVSAAAGTPGTKGTGGTKAGPTGVNGSDGSDGVSGFDGEVILFRFYVNVA